MHRERPDAWRIMLTHLLELALGLLDAAECVTHIDR